MAELKTKPTDAGVKAFLDAVIDPKRKADCQALIKLMKGITKAEPVLWGASIIQAGAGLVADSVPELEYQETVNKARAVLRAVAMARTASHGPAKWGSAL